MMVQRVLIRLLAFTWGTNHLFIGTVISPCASQVIKPWSNTQYGSSLFCDINPFLRGSTGYTLSGGSPNRVAKIVSQGSTVCVWQQLALNQRPEWSSTLLAGTPGMTSHYASNQTMICDQSTSFAGDFLLAWSDAMPGGSANYPFSSVDSTYLTSDNAATDMGLSDFVGNFTVFSCTIDGQPHSRCIIRKGLKLWYFEDGVFKVEVAADSSTPGSVGVFTIEAWGGSNIDGSAPSEGDVPYGGLFIVNGASYNLQKSDGIGATEYLYHV